MLDNDQKAQIARIDSLITTAKGSWFALLSYLAFVGVTLMGVEDADFFIPSRQTELPIIGVSVPTALFFYVAPILGAAVYAYFHFHLLKLWEQLSMAQERMDHAPLSDHIAPWLIADYALAQRTDGALRKRPLGRLAHYVVGGLAFWAAPLVLAAFWFQSMPKHDPWLSVLAIGVPLLLATYVGKRSHEQLVSLMKPKGHVRAVGKVAWLFVTVVTLLFGQMASFIGIYDDRPRMLGRSNRVEWPVSANLAGVAFTKLPDDWQSFEIARNTYRRTWCKERGVSVLACGEANFSGSIITDDLKHFRDQWCTETLKAIGNCHSYFKRLDQKFATNWKLARSAYLAKAEKTDLSKKDLRRANLSGAHLEGTNLRTANLERANLSDAYLEGANLRAANLERANLRVAHLEGVNLRVAHLEGADLTLAHLEGAGLGGAHFEEADLTWAHLERADLEYAHLERANFTEAYLQRADLRGAHLEGADFTRANLEGADLRGAHLKGANFTWANMEGADLGGAWLDARTSLFEASLQGAAFWDADYSPISWNQAQIDSAFGDASVILPSNLSRPSHWPDWKLNSAEFRIEWRKWQGDPASYIPPKKPS